jgi:hypothetical protein
MKSACPDLESLFHIDEEGMTGVVDETTSDGNHYCTVVEMPQWEGSFRASVTIRNRHKFLPIHPNISLCIKTRSGSSIHHRINLGRVMGNQFCINKKVELNNLSLNGLHVKDILKIQIHHQENHRIPIH